MAACGRTLTGVGRLRRLLLQCDSWKSAHTQYIRCAGKWIPPEDDGEVLPSFSERLAEWKAVHERQPSSIGINIGLRHKSTTNNNTELQRIRKWTKDKVSREKAARHRELKVNLAEVRKQWSKEQGPVDIRKIAKHCGIFNDMFDGAHFDSVNPLDVWYDYDEEFSTPVCLGNVITPKELEVTPWVDYESEDNTYWTLVMSSPDGNLEQNDRELLHWMVGNIPGNNFDQGQLLCHYLQPFPPKGAGFLRYVFILYKQNGLLDYEKFQKPSQCFSLRERSFSTLEFYRQFEDQLTPAGLAFFQSQWDPSVRQTFHHVLDMPEPKFEFIHPPHYFKEQEEFPHKRAFNMYLDGYRDVKDLNEEVLKYKLNSVDPFQPPKSRPKYPNIDKIDSETKAWARIKVAHRRLGKFHWKALYEEPRE